MNKADVVLRLYETGTLLMWLLWVLDTDPLKPAHTRLLCVNSAGPPGRLSPELSLDLNVRADSDAFHHNSRWQHVNKIPAEAILRLWSVVTGSNVTVQNRASVSGT